MLKRLATFILAATLVAACSDNDGPDIGPRVASSAALKRFDSCEELARKLKDNLREESRTMLLQYLDESNGWGWGRGIAEDSASFDGAPSAAADSAGREEGVDYSGTNNQETGVDEGDFVKTDGDFIYVLNGRTLVIVAVPEFGQLDQVATLDIEGYPQEMLIAGDTLVVFSQIYPNYFGYDHPLFADAVFADGRTWRTNELVKLTFVDISDRARPTNKRELYVEGYYQTSRKIETSIRLVSYGQINLWDVLFYPEFPERYWQLDWKSAEARAIRERAVQDAIAKNDAIIDKKPLSDFIPNVYERRGAAIAPRNFADAECAGFGIAEDSLGRGVTSIVSFDTTKEGYEADHVVSNTSVVYASADTLVIAEPSWNWWWFYGQDDTFDDATNLHRFDIATPGVSTYQGSGRVPGAVSNQFNLSEKDGVVRVSTTSNRWGRWWVETPPPVSSNVFTLSGDFHLSVLGELRGISPGETLWATRFVGDTAYLVTFLNIDPLWTVDLSDPAKLVMVSELEVPGVSTYVHPLSGGRLLSIGIAGSNTGLDWGTTQVSLFDVSVPTEPALAASLQLGLPNKDSWSYSEAQYEHKAFTYWEPKQTLAVPLSSYGYYSSGYRYYSSLELISVSADGLARAGAIDHTGFFNDPTRWWSNPGIRRSIFMGDYVVAVSDRGITATHLGDLVLTASLPLPGNIDPIWFY